ncbi:hypothetical protein Vadar_029448 [Vaccinium darrowii]|uniref:Uncharacterized protein n=1 Tax=Vaccinium darrowii TaxID=229202 RepID=A0ACB7Y315_9ERIC|nr:hypothetical protein Vadar_029448 [Vaccinium darrowii]
MDNSQEKNGSWDEREISLNSYDQLVSKFVNPEQENESVRLTILRDVAELRQWSTVQGYCVNFKELTDNQWFTGRRFVELLHKGTQRGNSSRCSTFASFHHGQAMGLAKLQEMTIEFARRSKNSGMSLPFGSQNPTTSTNASLLTTTKKISLEMEKREGRPTVRSINCEGKPTTRIHRQEEGEGLKSNHASNLRINEKFSSQEIYCSKIEEHEKQNLGKKNKNGADRFASEYNGYLFFSNRAVALGSCPKFDVLSPKQLRFSVWNHVIDLIRSRRQVICTPPYLLTDIFTGVPWTEQEHRMFLLGLQKLGKGKENQMNSTHYPHLTPTQSMPKWLTSSLVALVTHMPALFFVHFLQSDDTPVESHGFFVVNPPQVEARITNPLPAPPALDEECESMDSTNSNDGEQDPQKPDSLQCCYPVVIPAYVPQFLPFSIPFSPGHVAEPVKTETHERGVFVLCCGARCFCLHRFLLRIGNRPGGRHRCGSRCVHCMPGCRFRSCVVFAVQVIVMCNSAMAAGVPFVGWYHVRYQAEGSPTEGFYYVYTEVLVRTMAIVAYNRGANHVASKVQRNFRSKYGSVLPLGNVVRWSTGEDLIVCLSSMIYYSFLRLSGPAQSALKSTFIAAAIRKCGGNEEKGNLLYTTFGSNGQWGLFDKQFGRSDAQEPDPEGRVLQWEKASVQEMKDKCTAIGFGPC